MSENFEGNAAIYEFFDHLLASGYVLARRDAESGQLRAMKVRPTVEHEVLMFRGVDKLAFAIERSAMQAAYPHLWAKYGLADEAGVFEGGPEYAEPPREDLGPLEQVDRRGESVPDDMLLSVAEAFRRGVFTMTPNHNGVRVKLARCRRLYPELMPKMHPQGSQTLFRAGDLRAWEREYMKRGERNMTQAKRLATFGREPVQVEEAPPEVVDTFDALDFLMSKIREGKEDVR